MVGADMAQPWVEAQIPFGGVKVSGYSRFGGKPAIVESTDLRWVTIEDPNQHHRSEQSSAHPKQNLSGIPERLLLFSAFEDRCYQQPPQPQ